MSQHKRIIIVHIITSLGVGGAERVLSNLVLGMDRTKFCNVVISLQGLGHWGSILQQHGLQVYALQMRPNIFAVSKFIKLWQLLRKIKPDYLQGWMYHANVVALVVGKLAGIKNIYWNIRCSLMDLSQYKLNTTVVFKIGAWLAKFPTAIINNSRASIQQHSANGYKNSNCIYIPNGFDVEHFQPNQQLYAKFRQQHGLPTDAIIIGMIARFDPMKDHATFLRAAGILVHQRADVYFVCAGRNVNYTNSQLATIIAEYSIQDRVILLDQVNNVHELYPALDYLTQTSIFGEGFPNVVAEAMACGVQCFVTDVGDSLEVVGESGYQIAKQDPDELAAQWLNIIAQREAQVTQVARARIVEQFSLQKVIAAYSNFYMQSGHL